MTSVSRIQRHRGACPAMSGFRPKPVGPSRPEVNPTPPARFAPAIATKHVRPTTDGAWLDLPTMGIPTLRQSDQNRPAEADQPGDVTMSGQHQGHGHGGHGHQHGPGCGHGHGQHGHEVAAVAEAALVTDPVCGMKVDPATSKHRLEHRGTTFHFCSAGCRTKFEANPEK